jgi:hypothetical protein
MLGLTLRSCAAIVGRTWLLIAITVTASAVFAAHATQALLEATYLTPETARPPRVPAAPAAPAPPPPRRDPAQLVARNMFCSSCAAPHTTAADAVALAGSVLIATGIGDEPRATLRVLASEVQGSWGVGDGIPGLGRVARIAPTWIEISDASGRLGRLSLRDPATAAAETERGTATPEPPAPSPWASRLHKLDDQNYEVERSLVRDLVGGGAKAGLRPVPVLENGEIKGIRLLGVTPGSVAAALGLQNRDTLSAIDGAPIKNVQQLLDLYARLDQVTTVELSGTRGGKPLVRTLRLR